jgi:two-component system LytT family response regulator
MTVYLLDDEPLAVKRLQRMLGEMGQAEIVGASSDPRRALDEVRRLQPDVLFLDIEMPDLSGFAFLEQLGNPQPLVVFTTAYDEYALEAFKVNSIDYLLKPVEPQELQRALTKLGRVLGGTETRGDMTALLEQVRAMLARQEPEYLARIPSRIGERVEFVDVSQVTHFYAKDKLTFAVCRGKDHVLDLSIAELEQRLPPKRWLRIHRSTLLNLDAVKELHTWFGGRLLVRLKDGKTELQVARERAAAVRTRLGL